MSRKRKKSQDLLVRRAVGRRVAQIRKKKGLSKYVVSKRAGVHHPVITKIEEGSCDTRISTLVRIVLALEIKMIDFWKGVK